MFLGSSLNSTAMIGSSFSIPCTVNENATTNVHDFSLTWYFRQLDSTESVAISDDSRHSIENGVLTVTSASYQDAGVYTCRGNNIVGTNEQDNFVVIEGKLKLMNNDMFTRSHFVCVWMYVPFVGGKLWESGSAIEAIKLACSAQYIT